MRYYMSVSKTHSALMVSVCSTIINSLIVTSKSCQVYTLVTWPIIRYPAQRGALMQIQLRFVFQQIPYPVGVHFMYSSIRQFKSQKISSRLLLKNQYNQEQLSENFASLVDSVRSESRQGDKTTSRIPCVCYGDVDGWGIEEFIDASH